MSLGIFRKPGGFTGVFLPSPSHVSILQPFQWEQASLSRALP